MERPVALDVAQVVEDHPARVKKGGRRERGDPVRAGEQVDPDERRSDRTVGDGGEDKGKPGQLEKTPGFGHRGDSRGVPGSAFRVRSEFRVLLNSELRTKNSSI